MSGECSAGDGNTLATRGEGFAEDGEGIAEGGGRIAGVGKELAACGGGVAEARWGSAPSLYFPAAKRRVMNWRTFGILVLASNWMPAVLLAVIMGSVAYQ